MWCMPQKDDQNEEDIVQWIECENCKLWVHAACACGNDNVCLLQD